METILEAVDLTAVTAWVIAAGVLIIGINMAFKGITLGKRATKAV